MRLKRVGGKVKMKYLDNEEELLLLLREYSKMLSTSEGYEEAFIREGIFWLQELYDY